MIKKYLCALACIMVIVAACVSRQSVKTGGAGDLKKDQIVFSGGAGDSYETAIIIKAPQTMRKQEDAIAAEYDYISGLYGKKDKEWAVEEQSMVKENEKVYDMVRAKIISNGKLHFFYFDISAFVKKPKPVEPEENKQQ
ncbi:MAG TPA: hypothetical protein VF335_00610 [Chitinivibrionales bacterium]